MKASITIWMKVMAKRASKTIVAKKTYWNLRYCLRNRELLM